MIVLAVHVYIHAFCFKNFCPAIYDIKDSFISIYYHSAQLTAV